MESRLLATLVLCLAGSGTSQAQEKVGPERGKGEKPSLSKSGESRWTALRLELEKGGKSVVTRWPPVQKAATRVVELEQR